MEIKKLIKVYENLLPIYKAQKTRPDVMSLLGLGMCSVVSVTHGYREYDQFSALFYDKGYYRNLNENDSYLFKPAYQCKGLTGIKKRIDFMESEIKDLKRLQKKGYTHV